MHCSFYQNYLWALTSALLPKGNTKNLNTDLAYLQAVTKVSTQTSVIIARFFLQCLFKFVNSCFNIITKELQNGAKRRDRDRSCCQRMSPCAALQYKGLYRFYVTQSSSFLICVSTTVYSLIKPYIEDITWPLGDTKFLFACFVMFYLLCKHQWNTKPFHLRCLNTVLAVCRYMSFAKSWQEKGCSSQAKTWQVNNIVIKDFDRQVKCNVFVVSMATWAIEYNLKISLPLSLHKISSLDFPINLHTAYYN